MSWSTRILGVFFLAFAIQHQTSVCRGERIDLGTFSIQGIVTLKITYDTDKREIRKEGSVLGQKVSDHTTGADRVRENVFHFHDKEEFKIAGKKVAGLKWNCAVDIERGKLIGHQI